jgi:signal recognition particle GTPase
MDSGEISRDELMQETQDMMKKMQEMGGVDNFADMLKGMADKMGMGKNARIDKNAIKKMESNMKLREQMRKKLDIRKATNNIVKNENTGELNFVCGEEKQEKSYLEQNAEIDKIMDELNLNAKPNNKKSKKPKKTNK